jgi:hypothetical protein
MRDNLTIVQPIKLTNDAEIQKAQRYVGTAMTACLGFWTLPVISGVICAKIERTLITKTLKVMGCYSDAGLEKVFWFFRQKTFFLYVGTYLPGLGVPLQLLETYGIGQFAIHCALRPELLTNDAWLQQSWNEIEPDILSGEHAIQSYEQFTGSTFPDKARKKFLATVNFVNQLYLYTQKFPGAVEAQKGLADLARELMRLGIEGITDSTKIIAAAAKYVDKQATKVIAHADNKMEGFLSKSRAARERFNAETEAKYGLKPLDTSRNVGSDTKG